MTPKPIFEIDGTKIRTLEDFFDEISRVLRPGVSWERNLDAFNDILRGGFSPPQIGGFVLRWNASDTSRERLSYPETVRELEKRLERCHPSNRESVRKQLAEAQQGRGAVVFDWLVDIIRDHGSAGNQSEDQIELILA